jgi:hypothetical protein
MGASEWIAVAGVLVAGASIAAGYLLGRRAERFQREQADLARRETERAQREHADHERRADLYPALNEWAAKVTSKSHVDREERERLEHIRPDVMARALSYASPAVLSQLHVMTNLRARRPETFVKAEEKKLRDWEMRASFRRSELLRREARALRAMIRNELGADPFTLE